MPRYNDHSNCGLICAVDVHDSLLAALQVLVLTPHIQYYLAANDPMALKQAQEAIAWATSPAAQ